MDTRDSLRVELAAVLQGVDVNLEVLSAYIDRAYEVGRTEGYTAGLAEQVGGEEE